MPRPSLNSIFFVSSGSEAFGAALKMVRGITQRQNVVTIQGAYCDGSYEEQDEWDETRYHSHHVLFNLMLRGAPRGVTSPCI